MSNLLICLYFCNGDLGPKCQNFQLYSSCNSSLARVARLFPLTIHINFCTSMTFEVFLKCRSRPSEHHRQATSVHQVLYQIANLLPSIIRPCNIPFRFSGSTDSTPLKNQCAPPLNPALHCHCCGPHFTTTGTVVDNRPTPWICQTDNLAKIRLTVWA